MAEPSETPNIDGANAGGGFVGTFFSPEFIEDPYPSYRFLLEHQPLFKVPDAPLYIATRYADCQDIVRDRRLGHAFRDGLVAQWGESADKVLADNAVFRNLGNSILLMDPPDHRRIRGLVAKAFDARRTEAMRPRVRALAHRLIDAFEADGEGDLVSLFTYPLPVIVICEMLGIPEADHDRFIHGNRIAGRVIDPTPMTPEELAEANAGSLESFAYFAALLDARRARPEDDLLTALVQAETEDGKLSYEEMVANVSLLFGAGHETTVNLMGNGLLALWRNPEQLAALRADLSLMPRAVEEMLRFDSSVQLTGRKALEDLEFKGLQLRKGDQILALIGAANHDPAAFSEPERFDISRDEEKPLSFGGGIHHCLGAQLTRVEAVEALQVLFERLPKLELLDVDAPKRKPTITLRGLTELRARW
ncbi:MAG: cytochrome P450 [Pseudomonadales bacterium]|jgi:cytochrome P450|nr:cytochrome P450 [Pseudomonadales bacterium]